MILCWRPCAGLHRIFEVKRHCEKAASGPKVEHLLSLLNDRFRRHSCRRCHTEAAASFLPTYQDSYRVAAAQGGHPRYGNCMEHILSDVRAEVRGCCFRLCERATQFVLSPATDWEVVSPVGRVTGKTRCACPAHNSLNAAANGGSVRRLSHKMVNRSRSRWPR